MTGFSGVSGVSINASYGEVFKFIDPETGAATVPGHGMDALSVLKTVTLFEGYVVIYCTNCSCILL